MNDPQPIDADDIRVGDRVMCASNGFETTFTVDHVDAGRIYAEAGNSDHASTAFLWASDGRWTLLDRPAPAPDLSLIPSSQEEARPVEVNGVVVTCWRDPDGYLWMVYADGKTYRDIEDVEITSVRSVTVLADDQVAVPKAELDQLRETYAEVSSPRTGYLDGYGWRERVRGFLAAVDRGEGA